MPNPDDVINQDLSDPKEKKIVVWVPCLKTTMEIAEKDFNSGWMVKPKSE